MKKITHLSWEERKIIRAGLYDGLSFVEIGLQLERNPTTIRNEVKRNRFKKEKVELKFGASKETKCVKVETCRKRHICEDRKGKRKCKIPCRKCLYCAKYCKDFKEDVCEIETKAPFVCNGCNRQSKCRRQKYYYGPDSAHKNYKKRLSDSREGVQMSRDEMNALDELVSPLIKKGQPISHIYATHEEEIGISKRTLYHYIDLGYLQVKNLDLRRKVRYSKRRKRKVVKVDEGLKKGRQYKDFLQFMEEHDDHEVVEMDTVEGVKGGKLLLTMKFLKAKLFLIRLLEDKQQETVLREIDAIEQALGLQIFRQTLPLLLTDNGVEFGNPLKLEQSFFGGEGPRTQMYYCDPNSSWQKGAWKKNTNTYDMYCRKEQALMD